ncbi:hypothetical protein A3D62_00495 [Candidatus Kaiserbacteria bacterium RIFCSPHIGHO2_02_FULL_49_11]|uniref:Peptidase S11 D-alanyl-D-alanine carboxypeptidase A N-terminal domain-containing protein n=1 Tax=Candidatus Kaiserbacteria bacterium RIFCSPHIGHO2_02_FULL_49_11 TaxID=1798489 RepID=A0A1F6CYZ5_9BACT|nr:MAG: hypothetical protein A3D62_00495 [Candidatus Kaiserbacteria bacterium RIFCSPHIGHO2_02_FULL_49_11]
METQKNNEQPQLLPELRKPEQFALQPYTMGLLSLVGALMLLFFVVGSDLRSAPAKTTPLVESTGSVDPFEQITLNAQATYVYDAAENSVYFAKNEEVQMPLASLTKIMTALVASEFLSDNETITITADAIAKNGDTGLKRGERWRFKDLLDYTLLVSSNDGASAVAAAADALSRNPAEGTSPGTSFVLRMNERASALGLTQTYFINESGLDTNKSVGGGYGSARDVGLLLAHVISNYPNLLEATTHDSLQFVSENQFTYKATNTNLAAGKIPGLIASKTGYTELAGGNLTVAFDAGINHPVIIVVLGSSYDGRFSDIEKLVAASIKKITSTAR